MMYDLDAALAFSIGNKVKAREPDGDIIIVYAKYALDWTMEWMAHSIDSDGEITGFEQGDNSTHYKLVEFLESHKVHAQHKRWIPVELSFPIVGGST